MRILCLLGLGYGTIGFNSVFAQTVFTFEDKIIYPYHDFLLQSFDSTLTAYGDSSVSRFSRKFGVGTLIALRLIPERELSGIKVYLISGYFYGGSSTGSGGLKEAGIEAMVWINTSIEDINSVNYHRKSELKSLKIEINEMRKVDFLFSDTTSLGKAESLIWGFYYKNGEDSLNSVSPVFSEPPLLYPHIYLEENAVSSTQIDTVRRSHTDFWSDPDQVGSILSTITIGYDSLGIETAVEFEPMISKPYQIRVTNYPNPFNPNTTIHIATKEEVISAKIYSLTGQEIITLHLSRHSFGIYTAVWNPESNSTGLYLLRVNLLNGSYLHKMLYIK